MSVTELALIAIRLGDVYFAIQDAFAVMNITRDELQAEFDAARAEGRRPDTAKFADRAVFAEAQARELLDSLSNPLVHYIPGPLDPTKGTL